MKTLLAITILFSLFLISLIINISNLFFRINLQKEKGIAKLYKSNYDSLKLKQIRVSNTIKGPRRWKEVAIGSTQLPTTNPLNFTMDDHLRVIGVKGKNERILMTFTPWSEDELQKIIKTVGEFNNKSKQSQA